MIQFRNIITCIDAHTVGEPLRIVTSGFPPIPGDTILEKRAYVKEHLDHLRKLIMLEPRGHSGMYGCILTRPVTEDGDFGVLFTHNEGLSTMCGHGIIGLSKVALETGMVVPREGINELRIDSPAGRVTSFSLCEGGRVKKVSFHNVPSFVYLEGIRVPVEGIGEVTADVVYGGAFYVFLDAAQLGLDVVPEQAEALVRRGMEIKHKVMEMHDIEHPLEKGLHGIYGTILTTPPRREGNRLVTRNVCVFADAEVDRSPCGTGTSARVAQLFARGVLRKDQILENHSIIDTVFEGRVLEETVVAGRPAVIPEISGTAHIMGFNQLVLDPEDPLPEGFRILGS